MKTYALAADRKFPEPLSEGQRKELSDLLSILTEEHFYKT